MSKKCPEADYPGMTWRVQDISQPGLETAGYELVVDKGTTDAMIGTHDNITDMLCEIHQALVPRGTYIIVSLYPAELWLP